LITALFHSIIWYCVVVARQRLNDVLQSHLFWAFDASDAGVPIFNPLFGFSRISAPEINTEIETFKDGTFLYNRSIVKGGSVSPVTFERASSMFDSDFYDWIMFTLNGNKGIDDSGLLGRVAERLGSTTTKILGGVSPRRSILVVQFTNINIANLVTGKIRGDDAIAIGIAAGFATLAGSLLGGAAGGLGVAAAALGIGPFQFATRVPARAWLLRNCIPVRYRSGSDFDASNAQVSLQELEVQPEQIEEFALGIRP
jgi:phage tail-like protein